MESDEDPENYTSPRPMPKFYHEQDTFSTKKSKLALGLRIGTPLDCAPPRPPVKSAPPVSRIFPHRRVIGPQPVSFRKAHSLDSVCYNHSLKLSYFEQCFIILEKIGHGSFGEVFKVQSREDGQLYAVKKTQEKFRSESDRRRKLEEVAKYEMLMEHKNVVKFYRAWEEDRILYIQMELCELSLSQYALMHHTIPEMTIWCFLIDLLFGVKHLHDNNLVHMDIKPENVFISSQNYCKLGDLGLVIDLSKKKDHSEGTEGDAKYLAPELMAGHFGKPADIFSLGITIMELASDLDVPKGGEKWHELRQGGLPTQFMTSRSSTLRSVIAQMLEPDFTKRPTVDQILAMSSMRKYLKSRIYHYQMINVTRGSTVTQANLAKLQSRANTSTMDDDGAPGADISISDEEMHDDSLAGNSMTVHPFDDSRADDEVDGMFVMPLPHRQVVTEPVIRYRPMFPSPISSSPVSARKKRSDCPASPVDGAGVNHSFESEKSITPPRPRVLFPDDYEDEEDKLSKIEPKNLMEAFNTAVEDEDISL